ncbi:MAG TPA: NAD(P)-dependent oxidoreductase [Xanthobacteraceae bacterium]
MKVALIGASGNIGSQILAEAVSRGHAVTAIARNPERIAPAPGVAATRGDIADADGLAAVLRGHDAIISSVRFRMFDPLALLGAVRASGVRRLIMVGGAGSLEVRPGVALVDTPEFPAVAKPEAEAGRTALTALRGEREIEWTFVSPSAVIAPGERTGKFRLGGDELLVGGDGKSRISIADFAIALVDELEHPRHIRRRFTVGY